MKKLLVICTAFSPENAIGSIRNTKFVKYLVQAGFDITVISPELDLNVKIDSTLASKELFQINHINVPYSNLFNRLFLKKRNEIVAENSNKNTTQKPSTVVNNKIKSMIYRILQELYTIIRNQDWKNQVLKYLSNHKEIDGYDFVFTGYPSLSSHLLGESVLKRKIADKWVADFRDPIAYKSLNSAFIFKINSELQESICKKASVITYISENMIEKLASEIDERENFFYLPNGYDEDDIKTIQNSTIHIEEEYQGILKIAYAGSLYGGKRDISILFKMIRALVEENKIEMNKIKFFYAGKEFNTLIEQALRYNLEGILINMGYISREESLSIQAQSNLVVVNTWNTKDDQGLITGKVYECFLLKKPTLAIINGTVPNSELGNMINKAGLGLAYETMLESPEADIELERFLLKIYKCAINKKEYQMDLNLEYIDQFNYKNIVYKFVEILEAI